jgi:DNA-directed RNA polymerase subunit M/transcription elongation factor TFIIS
MATDTLPIIVVTLGVCRNDHTWSEEIVEFECDPEFENDAAFNLNSEAFQWWCYRQVEGDQKKGYNLAEAASKVGASVAGSFVSYWTWKADFDKEQKACPFCSSEKIERSDDLEPTNICGECKDCGFQWREYAKE